jgi:DNA-binding transcriptional LysR family regulator
LHSGLGVTLLPALSLCAVRRPDVAVRTVEGRQAGPWRYILPLAERHPPAVTAMIAALREAAAALAAQPERRHSAITAAG